VVSAKNFFVSADETSDNGLAEQLSFSFRFVKNNEIHEEFLYFVPINSTTGEALADCIFVAT